MFSPTRTGRLEAWPKPELCNHLVTRSGPRFLFCPFHWHSGDDEVVACARPLFVPVCCSAQVRGWWGESAPLADVQYVVRHMKALKCGEAWEGDITLLVQTPDTISRSAQLLAVDDEGGHVQCA